MWPARYFGEELPRGSWHLSAGAMLQSMLILMLAACSGWTVPRLPAGHHGAIFAAAHQRTACLTMQAHDGASDDEDDFFPDEPRVNLLEPGTGRVLTCFMAASLEFEGETFAALYPVDAPCTLAEMNGDRLMPIDEDKESDALLEQCVAACAEASIELMDTPVVLTARGPGLELTEGDVEALQIEVNETHLERAPSHTLEHTSSTVTVRRFHAIAL